MLTFIKLGGSLITNKRETELFQAETMQNAAREIASARAKNPALRLLLGHGSGSFGHVAAQRYGTAKGVYTHGDWLGFAEVAVVARRLNNLVIETLHDTGLPVFPISPSASARCDDGKLEHMDLFPIQMAVTRGLVPVIYGDVALDSVRGGTIISTEAVFFYLAEKLLPDRIFLLGEVEGVYDPGGSIIPKITPGNYESIAGALGGSHGTDVTGGMASKVRTMVTLVKRIPGLHIHIFGGTQHLEEAILGNPPGTLICED